VIPSPFSSDITEFLFLLHTYEVRYLVIGGEAVIYYGYARLTGDVDIGSEQLIRNKEAARRDKDLDDLRFLKRNG
jgi:hypothetical protein